MAPRLISKTIPENRYNFACIRPVANHSFVSVGSFVTKKGVGITPLTPGHFLTNSFLSATGKKICAESADTNLPDPRSFTIYGIEVKTRSANVKFFLSGLLYTLVT